MLNIVNYKTFSLHKQVFLKEIMHKNITFIMQFQDSLYNSQDFGLFTAFPGQQPLHFPLPESLPAGHTVDD